MRTTSHAEVTRAVRAARLGVGASDLHGSLTGFLCAGGKAGAGDWLSALALDDTDAAGEAAVFEQLHGDVVADLADIGLDFTPLLPRDDASLGERAEALVEWCRGFLGGIGLADAGTAIAALDDDGKEILHDIGQVAASRLVFSDDDEEDEEDETSLSELVEFIRVGVLTLHAGMRQATAGPARRAH